MSTKTGAAGEFIVCSSILKLNGDWKVVHTPQDRIDVIAFDYTTFLRISVKTSSIQRRSGTHRRGYHFQNCSGSKKKTMPNPREIDIVAHCFLDDRKVAYYATEEISRTTQRRPLGFADSPSIEQDTWDKAVQIVRARVR